MLNKNDFLNNFVPWIFSELNSDFPILSGGFSYTLGGFIGLVEKNDSKNKVTHQIMNFFRFSSKIELNKVKFIRYIGNKIHETKDKELNPIISKFLV